MCSGFANNILTFLHYSSLANAIVLFGHLATWYLFMLLKYTKSMTLGMALFRCKEKKQNIQQSKWSCEQRVIGLLLKTSMENGINL